MLRNCIISFLFILFAILIYTQVSVANTEVVVTLSDGSSYGITYLGNENASYSYSVREISGKNLSHFVIELPICVRKEAFVSSKPDSVVGYDPTTQSTGIKWNTESDFTQGIFTFELDEKYPVGEVDVYFKAATMVNSGKILGPLCDSVSPTNTTTPTATKTETETPTSTVTVTETETSTQTPTATATATAEAPTATLTPTNTDTPVPTETNVVEDTATPTLTVTSTTEAPTNESDGIEPKKSRVFMPLINK